MTRIPAHTVFHRPGVPQGHPFVLADRQYNCIRVMHLTTSHDLRVTTVAHTVRRSIVIAKPIVHTFLHRRQKLGVLGPTARNRRVGTAPCSAQGDQSIPMLLDRPIGALFKQTISILLYLSSSILLKSSLCSVKSTRHGYHLRAGHPDR